MIDDVIANIKNAHFFEKLYYIIHFSLLIQLTILVIFAIIVSTLLILTCKTKADELLPKNSIPINDEKPITKYRTFSEGKLEEN